MCKGVYRAIGFLVSGIVLSSTTVEAQQSLAVNAGYFAVRGESTRGAQDVLVENLSIFAFDLKEFNGLTVGGEWIFGISNHLEAGLGIGFYQRTVPSIYSGFVDTEGLNIFQEFRLQVIPVTTTLRLFPFSREGSFQPYVGIGVGVFKWDYSEFGDFIDFGNFDIFRDQFVADGIDIGSLFLGGVRFPFFNKYAVAVEFRYQSATGEVGINQGFLNEDIDLGGLATQFNFQVSF